MGSDREVRSRGHVRGAVPTVERRGPRSESFDAGGDGPAGTAHTKTSAPDSVLDTDRRNTSDNHTGD